MIVLPCTIQGVETVDASHFITPENIERLQQAKEANRVQVCNLSSSLIVEYGSIVIMFEYILP